MKNIIQSIYINRYFLLFILLFAYVHSIYTRILVWDEINIYIFTPEAAVASLFATVILFFVMLFFIKKWQRTDTFSIKENLKIFASSLVIYLIIMQLVGLLVALIFDTFERNFNRETLIRSTISNFLDGFIYGSFLLAYYYYNKNKKHQQQLIAYNRALAESKINQLKTQLNPHFLFNNLNVLDQLIEEDKHEASDFLNEFAEIYRYVLQASEKQFVTIDEELDFVKKYFKLMRHKYGNAYQLSIENKTTNGLIVPLTLQSLVENAFQHNLGKAEHQICIDINIAENISVLNNVNLKRNNKPTSGRALNNLKEQYELLTEEPIRIEKKEGLFMVTIPIIYSSRK